MELTTFEFNNTAYVVKIWNNEFVGSYLCLDTETEIVSFTETPDIITMQVYGGGNTVYYVELKDVSRFMKQHDKSNIIMQNAPFDMSVLQKFTENDSWVYPFYDENRIWDTGILYRLLHLATLGFTPPRYNLNLLAEKFLGLSLTGKGEEQTGFSQFKDVPVRNIPENYLQYGAIDVVATFQIYHKLINNINNLRNIDATTREAWDKWGVLSHHIQVKGDYALNKMYKNGIGFDLASKEKWLDEKDIMIDGLKNKLATWGWVPGLKGNKGKFEQILELLSIKHLLPKTEHGEVSSKKKDLSPYTVQFPFIKDYLDYQELHKATTFVRDTDVLRVHPKYNLLVNTGRTSCSKPNFQQLPRLGGIRELFIADEGKTLVITDYSTVELATLAQVLLKQYGETVMGDKINEGIDLHKYYASVMNNIDEKDVTKKQRQEAKAANFGFPGGLGIKTFREFAAGYGLNINERDSQSMKDAWFNAFPEMKNYLSGEQGYVTTLTGRLRGRTTYCAEKNTPFQGLAADGAKLALYNLVKEDFKIVGFVHDEIICEIANEESTEKLKQQEEIMISAMKDVVPDIKISVESMISKTYCK